MPNAFIILDSLKYINTSCTYFSSFKCCIDSSHKHNNLGSISFVGILN